MIRPETVPEEVPLAALVITTKLVALATLPMEAPAPEPPVTKTVRVAMDVLATKACGTFEPKVVV
jgi:hypothetical protein